MSKRGLTGELNEREVEVARLLGHGRSNKEIATETGLAYGTVKVYVARVLEKMCFKNRTAMAVYMTRVLG